MVRDQLKRGESLRIKCIKSDRRLKRILEFETILALRGQRGPVGPQIDSDTKAFAPGGGSQIEMLVDPSDRFKHLKVLNVRYIY